MLPAPVRWLIWVLRGMTPPKLEDLRGQEQQAAMRLYSTSRREVQATPTNSHREGARR